MVRFLAYLLTLSDIFNWVDVAASSCKEWSNDEFVLPFSHEDKCYTWSKDKVTWDEAKSACSDNGGSLVKISSHRIYNALMKNINDSDQCLWTGANDKEIEQNWTWVDGSDLEFHDWKLGFFHVIERFELDCGSICRTSDESLDWNWYQKRCSSTWSFLCEYGVTTGAQSSQKSEKINNQREYYCEPWPTYRYWPLGQVGSKCLTVSTEVGTWYWAKDSCSRIEGRLVKIPSADVNAFLTSHLIEGDCVWIGATDEEEEGNWRWIDGSVVLYNDWDTRIWNRLMNWAFDCGGICLAYWDNSDWNWSQLYCDDLLKFICEYDAVYMPGVVKGISDPIQPAPKHLKYGRVLCGDSTRLLYKPDMETTALLYSRCAAMCAERLRDCTIFNFNSVTKECVGFSSREALKGAKERNENWDVWEIV